jgi:hypothetical protein
MLPFNRPSFGERFSSKSNFMGHDIQAAVPVGGERETRLNVGGRKVGEVGQQFGNGHAVAEIIKYVGHGGPKRKINN